MSRFERPLRRIIERIGVGRLAEDAGLARVALKDLFPEDPHIVSVLTAAVEHGVLTALTDRDPAAPIDVLVPRLASGLRSATGVSDARARWAVAAWARALELIDVDVPDLPRTGVEPDVAGLLVAAPTLAATLPLPSETAAAPPAPAPAPAPAGEEVTVGRADRETVAAASIATETDDDVTLRRSLATAGPTEPASLPPAAPTPAGRPTAPDDHPGTADAPTLIRSATPASEPHENGTSLQVPTRTVEPSPVRPTRPARRSRRFIGLAVAVVALIAVGGAAALLMQPDHTLRVANGDAAATATVDGHTSELTDGSRIASDSAIAVRSGPLQLDSGDGSVRLGAGATARLLPSGRLRLTAGRAFLHASGTLSIDTTVGTTTVEHGRALVTCETTCSTTALDEPVTVTGTGGTHRLGPHEILASDTTSFAMPDALRRDQWLTTNDALDRQQHLTPTGIAGAQLVGSWSVQVTRSDLPIPLVRPMTITPVCTAGSCTLRSTILMSDHNFAHSSIVGTVRALSSAGSSVEIDYGSHPAQCRYLAGQSGGGGADGAETVRESLRFTGSGATARFSGSRMTRYSSSTARCAGAAYTASLTSSLSGHAGAAASGQLSYAAQQSVLNYVNSAGTGCAAAAGAPTAALATDVRCGYTGAGPSTVEYATYSAPGATASAYALAARPYGAQNSGDCSTGPCERVAPNGFGRLLLAKDGADAVLITFDPRSARLLVIARGSSVQRLATWWQEQQRTSSVYTSEPIPRVGV